MVVSNPATPLWSPSDQWSIEETLRLGDSDGSGPAVFGRIGQIEVDSEGRIYIFDAQANELRIFDRDGHHAARASSDYGMARAAVIPAPSSPHDA